MRCVYKMSAVCTVVLWILFGIAPSAHTETPTISQSANPPVANQTTNDFVKMTPHNLVDTLIRFGVIDIRADDVIDDYAKLNECDLFFKFYDNDFKWNNFRKALRQSIRQRIQFFPIAYYYDAQMQLGRYDFQDKTFYFTEKSVPSNVNLFSLQLIDTACDQFGFSALPIWYGLVLDEPLTIRGLAMPEVEAKAFLERLFAAGNEDRIVYARFNIRVTQVPYVGRQKLEQGKTLGPLQQEGSGERQIKIGGRIESVDFFEDSEHKKLIYTYEP